ncbi:MAG: NUDIX hydrolase [Actinomycetota bacterium]
MANSIPQQWEVLSKREVFDGRPWLRVFAERLRLPDGREIEGFYGLEMPDYAVIFATAGDRILVQRHYKHGPARVGIHLPAGYLEPGEEPLEAARRELREETGYVSDTWSLIGTFVNDGNRGAGHAHIFRARNARQVAAPSSDDLEEGETALISPNDLRQALREGDVPVLSIAAAIALAALDDGAERAS